MLLLERLLVDVPMLPSLMLKLQHPAVVVETGAAADSTVAAAVHLAAEQLLVLLLLPA